MIKKKIIIDTDIGDDVDDSFALALALKNPALDVIGITTVYKNAAMRAKIVKAELKAFHKTNIDVVAGLDKPLKIPFNVFKYETLDQDGKPIMTAFSQDYSEGADRFDAPDYLLEKAREYPHEITLVAIGPLTNLAAAIKKNPADFTLFKEIIMMGGSNSDCKEWNIFCDPEAADIVLKCGVPITMVPIECTIKCAVEDRHYEKLLHPQNEEESFLLDMYKRWRKDQTRPCQMHDCLALQELNSSYCEFVNKYIYAPLITAERGKTISVSDETPNVKIAIGVRNDEFMDSLFNTLYQQRVSG